jgi:hypothetical protein
MSELLEKAEYFVQNYDSIFDTYQQTTTKPLLKTDCIHTCAAFRWYWTGSDKAWNWTMWKMGGKEKERLVNSVKELPLYQVSASYDEDEEDDWPDAVEHAFTVIGGTIRIESWLDRYPPRICQVDEPLDHFTGFDWYRIDEPEPCQD